MLVKACVLLLFASAGGLGFGQTYLGAEGALKAINSPASVSKKIDQADVFRRSIEAYGHQAGSLSNVESARQWLGLTDRIGPLTTDTYLRGFGDVNSSLMPIISVLPAPRVWPQLELQLNRRLSSNPHSARDLAMLALVDVFQGHIDQARTCLGRSKGFSPEQELLAATVYVDLAITTGRGDLIESAYRREATVLGLKTEANGPGKSITLSDLDLLIGPDRARVLIRDLLQSFDGEIKVEGSASFKKLARDTALEIVDRLKHPQWSLANHVDGGPLFAALSKRFSSSLRGVQPNSNLAPDSYSEAAFRYVIYLVANNRTADALPLATTQENLYWFISRNVDDEIGLLNKRGKLEEFAQFLETLLSGNPSMNLFGGYVAFCNSAGFKRRIDDFLLHVPEPKRAALGDQTDRIVTDLLAKHEVKEAGDLLYKQLTGGSNLNPNGSSMFDPKLATLGRYLHRQDFVDSAIADAEKGFKSNFGAFQQDWVFSELVRDHRGAEAERFLADVLRWEVNQEGYSTPPRGSQELTYLVKLYGTVGRHADIVSLLEQAPNWGVADLAFLQSDVDGEKSIPFLAARSLAAVGRKKEAMRVLHFVLQSQRDLDEAYELLLKLDPENAGELLDTMHRVSPLASRPLMWKAEWLRQRGRLAEAEKVVRQAIALDPQNTQEWFSRARFQAWSILSGVERAEGKLEDSRVHLRKFENFAKYFDSTGRSLEIEGPSKRQMALTEDPNDFVLRFQVAKDLFDSGKRTESMAQIKEACRLLSTQVGPATDSNWWWEVDSGFFSMCEDILRKQVRENPTRASAYVVLGSFYENTGREGEAVSSYVKAVSLDRNYLLAWQGLAGLESMFPNDRRLSEDILENLIRLDPLDSLATVGYVSNFADVWSTAQHALSGAISLDMPVFVLPESEVALSSETNQNTDYQRSRYWPATPGSIVGSCRTITDLASLIAALPGGEEMTMRPGLCLLGAVCTSPFGQTPTDYMGANAVLSKMRTPPSNSSLADPRVLFANKLEAFGLRVATLPPEQAATDWLAFVRRCFALVTKDAPLYQRGYFPEVLKALPSPTAWPVIERQLSGQNDEKNQALLLLVYVLEDKYQAASTLMKSMEAKFDDVSPYWYEEISLRIAERIRDADRIENLLKSHAADTKAYGTPMRGGPSMDIPDVAPILGKERARKLLTYILLNAKAELTFSQLGRVARSTESLARDLVVELADRVAWPQWTLASLPGSGRLFQTFCRRFPSIKAGIANMNPMTWSTFDGAATNCVVDLYVDGQAREAKQLAITHAESLGFPWNGQPEDAIVDRLKRTSKLVPFLEFLGDLALSHPDSGLPQLYFSFATDNQSSTQTEQFLKRIVGLSHGYRKDNAEIYLRKAYLAEGKLREAAQLLLQDPPNNRDGLITSMYLPVGEALKRPDLIRRGLDEAETSVYGDFGVTDDGVVAALLAQGRGPKIEKRLIETLREAVSGKINSYPPAAPSAAIALANFYYRLGRYRDVVTLLERFSGWGCTDLAYISDSGNRDFIFKAASALAKVGRAREAREIVDHELDRVPSDEQDYALLFEIDPTYAAHLFERLTREHPTDPLPLVWSAKYFLSVGKLNAAESAIEHAIALDPGDLERTPSQRRFGARSVRAAIERRLGRHENGTRLSSYSLAAAIDQEASKFDQAGMYSQAVLLFRRELKLLPSDFWSRFRLAVDELKSDRTADGIRDIRDACRNTPMKADLSYPWYEQPSQVRRVIKAALESQVQQGSKNPIAYAILGNVCEYDEDNAEALRCYQRAVQLDPDCVLGWTGLSELTGSLPPKLSEQVAGNLVRLGASRPLYWMSVASDYRQTWLAAAHMPRHASGPVFDLPASRRKLESTFSQEFVNARLQSVWPDDALPPGNQIANDSLISQICSLIESIRG